MIAHEIADLEIKKEKVGFVRKAAI